MGKWTGRGEGDWTRAIEAGGLEGMGFGQVFGGLGSYGGVVGGGEMDVMMRWKSQCYKDVSDQ